MFLLYQKNVSYCHWQEHWPGMPPSDCEIAWKFPWCTSGEESGRPTSRSMALSLIMFLFHHPVNCARKKMVKKRISALTQLRPRAWWVNYGPNNFSLAPLDFPHSPVLAFMCALLFCSLYLVLRGTTILSFTVMADLIIRPFHNFCLCDSLFSLFLPFLQPPSISSGCKGSAPWTRGPRNETLRSLTFIPCLGKPFTRECQGLIIVKIIKIPKM